MRTSQEIERYYNSIAKGYNELYGEEQLDKAKALLKYIEPKGYLLDIGAGTGITTQLFSDNATCVLLDPSENLLNQARGAAVLGRAEYLPFPDNTFDTIISLTALHHANLAQALTEIYRVAKKDAVIGVTLPKHAKIDFTLLKAFKKYKQEKDWIFILSL